MSRPQTARSYSGGTGQRQWQLAFAVELEELGGEGGYFVVVEQAAALKAARALQATTWSEFVSVAGISFAELMDARGEEIEEYFGFRPSAGDAFSLLPCWGTTYFADVIQDPRQVAVDLVTTSPALRVAFQKAGFEIHCGTPGAGTDSLLFPRRDCIAKLPPNLAARMHEDEPLLRACLLGETRGE
jgi:hypothetical protein